MLSAGPAGHQADTGGCPRPPHPRVSKSRERSTFHFPNNESMDNDTPDERSMAVTQTAMRFTNPATLTKRRHRLVLETVEPNQSEATLVQQRFEYHSSLHPTQHLPHCPTPARVPIPRMNGFFCDMFSGASGFPPFVPVCDIFSGASGFPTLVHPPLQPPPLWRTGALFYHAGSTRSPEWCRCFATKKAVVRSP